MPKTSVPHKPTVGGTHTSNLSTWRRGMRIRSLRLSAVTQQVQGLRETLSPAKQKRKIIPRENDSRGGKGPLVPRHSLWGRSCGPTATVGKADMPSVSLGAPGERYLGAVPELLLPWGCFLGIIRAPLPQPQVKPSRAYVMTPCNVC